MIERSSKIEIEKKDDWSNHWQSYAKSASENPAQKMRHQLILEKVLEFSDRRELLLDVGSGQGDFLAKAVSLKVAKKYIGFELSEAGVAISRNKVKDAFFYQVDLFSPPVGINVFNNAANIIVCSDVIEHVDDPLLFCKLILNYLKPGGLLLLTVPGGPMSSFDRYIGHRKHFNKATISNLLEQAGYSVDAVKMAGFPFFNLYRLLVILRGSKLIQDAQESKITTSSFMARILMKIFGALFKLNLDDSRFGWQVFAIARNPSSIK